MAEISADLDYGVVRLTQTVERIKAQIGQVIVGKADTVELLLVALFCDGHVLLEDVPGIGKTTLAKTLARCLGCSFRRVQFTPDVLPSDITGVSVFNQQSNQFDFRAGPIFAQIVLADEINRAGPRTQSALLEAMEERQVSVDGTTYRLPYPFLVLATQNPVELEGTFPLPEAQLDRFLMRLTIGYPDREDERTIMRRFRAADPLTQLQSTLSGDDIRAANLLCRQIHVHPTVEDYLLDIVQATRDDRSVELGASPRGTLGLYRAGQALAAVRGRTYVLPDDVKHLVVPVLGHRLLLTTDARLRGHTAQPFLCRLLEHVPVPVEERWDQRVQGQGD